jgi:hypothetical protein
MTRLDAVVFDATRATVTSDLFRGVPSAYSPTAENGARWIPD